jgi:UDP-glucose 4-epimerase
MVLPAFVRAALAHEPIRVFGDGKQSRNFTYIDDCVDALVALMRSSVAVGNVFNIGGAEEISIGELAERVKSVAGSSSPIVTVPYEQAYQEGTFEDMRRRVPCTCRIEALIGWTPVTSLENIIRNTVAYEKQTNTEPEVQWRPFAPLLDHLDHENLLTTA